MKARRSDLKSDLAGPGGYRGGMDMLVRASWGLLGLVHILPALVLARPSLTDSLYGLSPTGDAGLLIIHRGALFLAVVVACLWAMADPSVRRVCSVLVAISVGGFLLTYLRGGAPAGSLRTIALVDAVALAPLALVAWRAWVGEG